MSISAPISRHVRNQLNGTDVPEIRPETSGIILPETSGINLPETSGINLPGTNKSTSSYNLNH